MDKPKRGRLDRLPARHRGMEGKGVRPKDIDPADTAGRDFTKEEATQRLAHGTAPRAAKG